jgi:hypothetical protein
MPTPSLILVPARFKTGKLYTPVATTSGGVVLGASGDFNVTRATTATRFNSAGLIESVASGVPRLDYYTSGGTAGCPALLVEPSAANGILNSADTTTSWTLGANLSSGYVDVIGVSGNNLTVAVSGSNIGANAGRHSRGANGVSLASGSTYTISFLMKKTGTHTIGAYYAVIGSQDISSGFDVSGSFSSGSIYNPNNATNRIRRVERFGTDVFRCSETFTMTASATLTNFHFAPVVAVTNGTNSASGTTMAFAAPQIELGAIPTSFIPTNTAAVTRNADVINVSGAVSGCVGQTEGTVYWEGYFGNAQGALAQDGFQIGNNANNYIYFGVNSGRPYFRLRANAINAVTISPIGNVIQNNQKIKIAIAYKSGNSALFVNGTQIGSTDTASFTFSSSLSAIEIGSSLSLSSSEGFSNSPKKPESFTFYTTRLTDTQLAALTTL